MNLKSNILKVTHFEEVTVPNENIKELVHRPIGKQRKNTRIDLEWFNTHTKTFEIRSIFTYR